MPSGREVVIIADEQNKGKYFYIIYHVTTKDSIYTTTTYTY